MSAARDQPPSSGFRGRMLGVLAVLVAVNALFVLALLWGFLVLIPTTVGFVFTAETAVLADLLRLPLSPLLCLVVVVGFLGAQVYYGYKRVLTGSTAGGGDGEHAVARTVRKLAMAADVPAPAVRVVDDAEPSCYTVGRVTDATIVVTTGLIDALDADELEAVLAHEVAHVANRDVTLMTVTTLCLEITERMYHEARLVRRAMTDWGSLTTRERFVLRFAAPLAALVYLLVAPVLWLFPRAAGWATRQLSHAREYAADAAAARLTGRPLALATALTELGDTTTAPETDLRLVKTCALCIVPAEPVTGNDTASLPTISRPAGAETRAAQITAWLDGKTPSAGETFDTHPPVERRVARLREIAAEVEGRG
ncbi:peptidase M48 [Halobacteriales archaeon QH_7_66_37]|nr:MAG: peptidase M48 [Halobacteriales archaeon QH_7_66_37]